MILDISPQLLKNRILDSMNYKEAWVYLQIL